jgi:hypothetical protein
MLVAVLSLVWMVIALPLLPWRPLRIKLCNLYGKVVGRGIVAIAGVTPHIDHPERLDGSMPAIYVMNHTSTLDAFLGVWMCPSALASSRRSCVLLQPLAFSHLLLDRFSHGRAISRSRTPRW